MLMKHNNNGTKTYRPILPRIPLQQKVINGINFMLRYCKPEFLPCTVTDQIFTAH